MEEELRKLISENFLDDFADAIVAQSKPAIGMVKEKTRPHHTGASQLGGVPDVAPGFVWPAYNDDPLAFVAQINFSELKEADTDRVFPDTGLLYLFCSVEEWPTLDDPNDNDKFRVIYQPAVENLSVAIPPADLRKVNVFPAIPIGFRRFLSIPDFYSAAGKAMGIGSNWSNEYSGIICAPGGVDVSDDTGKHQLLGWPAAIQEEMAVGDGRLLLAQIDTDGDLGIAWGGSGTLYFWITEEDLKACRFGNARAGVQCC